ncbi:M20/M25/M40 family metallo-hydrolase [Armatimonas sp.]|uniref:M20/M25/M40 family metallo-hydrolase n=1 Tax=Armatimonas sp. TaxID=1872638 RepID=UPI00286BDAC6|nr:M20/M25/M40 family metallo-hydrolase [Armatimonas sp.]
MSLTLFLIPLAALVAPAPRFQTDTPDAAIMAKIREEGLKRSQLPQNLSYLTEVIGPRLTGSPGLLRANEYTKNKMIEWGLDAKLEPWGPFGRGWTCDKFALSVVGPTAFNVIAAPRAWSTGWAGTADVVFVEAQNAEELAKFKGKLKGKIALISPTKELPAHFTPQGSRYTDEQLAAMASGALAGSGRPRQGGGGGGGLGADMTEEQRAAFTARARQAQMAGSILAFCKAEGAVATLSQARSGDGGTIFVEQASVPQQAPAAPPTPPAGGTAAPGAGGRGGGFGGGQRANRMSVYSVAAEKLMVPQIAVGAEHYNRIVRMVQAGEKVSIALDLKVHFNGDDTSMVNNTIGEWKGTDKADEIVMAGGHLDSWHTGTGATDNACGVSVAMEAVRILKAIGAKPRRTIRVACWSGEEQGIFGSSAYVKAHFGTSAAPGAEHAKFSSYFNLDNGTGKIRGVYCQGNTGIMPIFAEWLKPFNDLGATTVTARNTGGTDHLPFNSAGLPGFQFIQDTIEYDARTHHSNMDTFDRVQLDDMKQAATILAAFLYNAAMRDDKLPRKPTAGQ